EIADLHLAGDFVECLLRQVVEGGEAIQVIADLDQLDLHLEPRWQAGTREYGHNPGMSSRAVPMRMLSVTTDQARRRYAAFGFMVERGHPAPARARGRDGLLLQPPGVQPSSRGRG